VKFYGSFVRDNTYNIILELGDKGNLKEYLETEDPPREFESIIHIWKEILKIALAILQIHKPDPGSYRYVSRL